MLLLKENISGKAYKKVQPFKNKYDCGEQCPTDVEGRWFTRKYLSYIYRLEKSFQIN